MENSHKRILEIKKNMELHDFSFSEKMRVAREIEPVIQGESLKRKSTKTSSDYREFGISTRKGKTRDIVAEIVGLGSGVNYRKAVKIWESGDKDLIEKLDQGKIKINSAYNKIKNREKEEEKTANQEGKRPLNKTATIDILDFLIGQINECYLEEGEEKEINKKLNQLQELMARSIKKA